MLAYQQMLYGPTDQSNHCCKVLMPQAVACVSIDYSMKG
jgi:hypothetical protein